MVILCTPAFQPSDLVSKKQNNILSNEIKKRTRIFFHASGSL